jgi:hypothetical protein
VSAARHILDQAQQPKTLHEERSQLVLPAPHAAQVREPGAAHRIAPELLDRLQVEELLRRQLPRVRLPPSERDTIARRRRGRAPRCGRPHGTLVRHLGSPRDCR